MTTTTVDGDDEGDDDNDDDGDGSKNNDQNAKTAKKSVRKLFETVQNSPTTTQCAHSNRKRLTAVLDVLNLIMFFPFFGHRR